MLILPNRQQALLRRPKPSAEFLSLQTFASALTTYTTGTIGLGDGNRARRHIVFGAFGIDSAISFSGSSASVTPSGGAAIAAVKVAEGLTAGILTVATLWRALVPQGHDGTISVTWSEAITGCKIGAWAAYDLKNPTGTDAVSAIGSSAGADQTTSGLDVEADGIAFAIACSNFLTNTCAWAGVDESFDSTGTIMATGGFRIYPQTIINGTFTADLSTNGGSDNNSSAFFSQR